MKKEFMALMSNGLQKKEGDYDKAHNVYFHKEKDGTWGATDEFTGRLVVFGKKTKKECEESLNTMFDKIKEARQSEKYLQGYINYQEML